MAVDGGGLRYLGATADGYVRIELTGACAKCPRRMMTLDLAIETPLRSIGAARGVGCADQPTSRKAAPACHATTNGTVI